MITLDLQSILEYLFKINTYTNMSRALKMPTNTIQILESKNGAFNLQGLCHHLYLSLKEITNTGINSIFYHFHSLPSLPLNTGIFTLKYLPNKKSFPKRTINKYIIVGISDFHFSFKLWKTMLHGQVQIAF